MRKLNGWNRLAALLCVIWFICAICIGVSDLVQPGNGWFVSAEPPAGAIFTPGQLTLPNGRVVKLKADASVKPWQINWANEPQVHPVLKVWWANVFKALFLPFVVWLLLAVLTKSLMWVKAGFRARAT